MATPGTVDQRIANLEAQVNDLRKQLQRLAREPQAVLLRTVSRESAKQEIASLFETGRTLYYSDVVQELGIDIDLVIDLCRELEAEGRIVTLDDSKGSGRPPRRRTDLHRGKKNPKVASG